MGKGKFLKKKYLKICGFAILIDSENQPEKWIFKKIASSKAEIFQNVPHAAGPFIFDSWVLNIRCSDLFSGC